MDSRELKNESIYSTLAIRVALERDGTVAKDACWLRPENDTQHINLAALDAMPC